MLRPPATWDGGDGVPGGRTQTHVWSVSDTYLLKLKENKTSAPRRPEGGQRQRQGFGPGSPGSGRGPEGTDRGTPPSATRQQAGPRPGSLLTLGKPGVLETRAHLSLTKSKKPRSLRQGCPPPAAERGCEGTEVGPDLTRLMPGSAPTMISNHLCKNKEDK